MRLPAKSPPRFGVALLASALLCCVLATSALCASPARAESTWRLEQPDPPPPPAGVAAAPAPIGLGKVGDIKFWAPNRGVLITAGNPPTIPAGVWIYNGKDWRELSEVCGASDGRIAWAGPKEFWTVSNGRPGQAAVNARIPPLEDNTLCRFGEGKVVESFAAPAFEADSYQPMQAAACLGADNCWFGGPILPEESPEVGAFQLHWNGATLSAAPYLEETHTIEDLQAFEDSLYESVQLLKADAGRKSPQPPVLHVLEAGFANFVPEELLNGGQLYGKDELPWALNYLHLSSSCAMPCTSTTGTGALWAAAGQRPRSAEEAEEDAPVTVLRYTPEAGGEWTQLLGPETEPEGKSPFPGQTVQALAAEGGAGEEHAWLALAGIEEAGELTPPPSAYAKVARISTNGTLGEEETLPAAGEGGPKGPAEELTCPALGDCWMVTSQGWLFHLAPEDERTLPEDTESGFGSLITERPLDKGLPQTLPDSVPIDDSGLAGEAPELPPVPTVNKSQEEARVPEALVSAIHTRVVHGTTLELRLHLAVKAKIELVAKRKHQVVAKTPLYTFTAGEHKLLLRLNRKHWPTALHLIEHPLAPLPTVSAAAGGSETVET
jgi:hypothetical protein